MSTAADVVWFDINPEPWREPSEYDARLPIRRISLVFARTFAVPPRPRFLKRHCLGVTGDGSLEVVHIGCFTPVESKVRVRVFPELLIYELGIGYGSCTRSYNT